MNYGDLKSYMAEWLNRTDLTEQIPRFVRLAETEIFRELRSRENEFTVTYDNSTAAGAHLLLPENFREVKTVTWAGRVLRKITSVDMESRLGRNYDTTTTAFTIVERKLVLSAGVDNDPANWGDSTLEITYYGTESIDSLPVWQTPTNPVDSVPTEETDTVITQTDTNTNRLLEVAPDLYLAASMKYALLYLQKEGEAQMWHQQAQAKIESINRESKRADLAGSPNFVANAYEEPNYTYSRGSV